MQDCFLHWLVAPSRRRYYGVRRPLSGVLGVFLFLPSRQGPSPGWSDRRVEAALDVARSKFPGVRIVDFADDFRLADVGVDRDALAVGMTGLMSLLEQMGVRYHTMGGKGWWPTRLTPWLGFEVDAREGVVRVENRRVEKGLRRREGIVGARPGTAILARGLLASASFLNFLRWVAPCDFCHLRSRWDAANKSGAMD